MTQASKFWIFAYGSLLWNAGFEIAEQQCATLEGYERSFCMWSIHHRGTATRPGLVLALAKKTGFRCAGMALRCHSAQSQEVMQALRERELVSSAYIEMVVPLTLADGRSIAATAFVVDQTHRQYCPDLTLDEQAEIIAHATGGRGTNRDYLEETVARLNEIGIPDTGLASLVRRVRDCISMPGRACQAE
ncbi:MAG: gamma-glutamylcyclotransferase [Rhodobacteraceae bacterium]|nr:gamma-glutamylcyclotransferase [Paracoccaceae bacterium]